MTITRNELIQMRRMLDSNRIWGGMSWTYLPIPPFKYLKVLAIIQRELDEQEKDMK